MTDKEKQVSREPIPKDNMTNYLEGMIMSLKSRIANETETQGERNPDILAKLNEDIARFEQQLSSYRECVPKLESSNDFTHSLLEALYPRFGYRDEKEVAFTIRKMQNISEKSGAILEPTKLGLRLLVLGLLPGNNYWVAYSKENRTNRIIEVNTTFDCADPIFRDQGHILEGTIDGLRYRVSKLKRTNAPLAAKTFCTFYIPLKGGDCLISEEDLLKRMHFNEHAVKDWQPATHINAEYLNWLANTYKVSTEEMEGVLKSEPYRFVEEKFGWYDHHSVSGDKAKYD